MSFYLWSAYKQIDEAVNNTVHIQQSGSIRKIRGRKYFEQF